MAPAEFMSADTNDGTTPVATVETKATLTLPGGWCCGFAHRRAEDLEGRLDVETVFVTRGGLRMTYHRECDGRSNPRRPSPPSQSFGADDRGSSAILKPRGSRVDLLV
jgi:hypothetical protein